MAKVWSLNPVRPERAAIKAAAEKIQQGGVVVVPTRGLYGLGADAFNAGAIERIYKIKGRSLTKALLVLIADRQDLAQVAMSPNEMAAYLMGHFWPGRVTFVLAARPDLPPALTANSGKIGVRLVEHPVAAALVRQAGTPLTGTSANLSGSGGSLSIDQVDGAIVNGVDGILDAGQLSGGPGSTVVEVTGPVPEILREGAVEGHEIMACYKAFCARRPFSE